MSTGTCGELKKVQDSQHKSKESTPDPSHESISPIPSTPQQTVTVENPPDGTPPGTPPKGNKSGEISLTS